MEEVKFKMKPLAAEKSLNQIIFIYRLVFSRPKPNVMLLDF